jgi:hypothetical protein
VIYLRRPLSPFLWGYIKGLLSTPSNASRCKSLVEEALKCTCHVARVRSVAYAAGYCAYYARMIEKMGVFEAISGSISGKGRTLHKLLALAAQDLFLNHTLGETLKNCDELIQEALEHAADVLDQDVEKRVKGEAIDLMKKLLKALSRAREKRLINSSLSIKLFPIAEQELIDFDDHMYGAPDLILEDLDGKKAVVVEWKSYEAGGGGRWNDVDIAQVAAYAIMEARRLGIRGLRNTFKAILGVDVELVEELSEALQHQRERELGVLVSKALMGVGEELRVLPLIVSKSDSYPPHPLMYKDGKKVTEYARRFVKLYEILKRVVVAAEHLTLQLTNVESLLTKVTGQSWEEVRSQLDYCRSGEGYLAFNYIPSTILPRGKPREQGSWPCRTGSGKFFCSFAGENNACMFYFGRREREEFEALMWRLRYEVFEGKERSLASYKVMDILFRRFGLRWLLSEDIERKCKGFKVDVAGETAHVENDYSVVFYVRAYRGGEELGKIRFDVLEPSDVDAGDEEGLILKRRLRKIETEKNIIGTVKKSVAAYVVEPRLSSPLFSINTFLMINDVDLEEGEVVYYLYSPSPVLHHNLKLFKQYIEALRGINARTRLLLFEAPANLTIMELRAIDALHRYIALLMEEGGEKRRELIGNIGISDDELANELDMIKKESSECKAKLEESTPLREVLREVFGGARGGK